MKEPFCETCNKKIDFVYVDGYSFGDRIMEGVMFKVKETNGKPECIGLHPNSEAYMKQFNWKHWKKMCEEYCMTLDIAACPECSDDVVIEDDETAESRPEPVVIGKAYTIDEVLPKIKEKIEGK